MKRYLAAYGRNLREAARMVVLVVVPGFSINKLSIQHPTSDVTIFGSSFWEWFAIWLMPVALAFTLVFALLLWGASEVDGVIARHKNK